MFDPLSKLDTSRGAPKGRLNKDLPLSEIDEKSLYLRRVLHSFEAYDSGGAYWGHGEPIYCCWNATGTFVQYVRAKNREKAKEVLCGILSVENIDNLLKQKTC